MKEQVFSIILAIIVFTLGQLLNLNNATLSFLFQFIPVLIPTYIMWKNIPKNYLKFIVFKKKDIKYIYTIKISTFDINIEKFNKIRDMLLNVYDRYKGTAKRIIKNQEDELILSSFIKVDTTLIELNYYKDDGKLYIASDSTMSYRLFIKRINLINDIIIQALSNVIYDEPLIQLKIEFLSLDEDNCRNPFIKKIFEGFEKKVISIKYKSKRGNEIDITNNTIEFMSKSLNDLNDDIIDELSIIKFIR